MSESSYKQTDTDWMFLNCLYMNSVGYHNFLKHLGKEAKIGNWPVMFYAFLIESGFLQ